MTMFEVEGPEDQQLPHEHGAILSDVTSTDELEAYLSRRGKPEVRQHQPMRRTVWSYALDEVDFSD